MPTQQKRRNRECKTPEVLEEEDIGRLSLVTYRRTATMIHFPAVHASGSTQKVFGVDPEKHAEIIRDDTGHLLLNETMHGELQ